MAAAEDRLKLFSLSNQLVEHELDRVEREFAIDLRRQHKQVLDSDEDYYPQIEQEYRSEAAAMAPRYEVFYSLEKSIRRLISDPLEAEEGPNWWTSGRIPSTLQQEVADRQQREMDSGTTPRSSDPIDFTTFGELGEIIKKNWDVFDSLFTSVRAVEKVMSSLNTLRGPIAHCSLLAEDEVLRLRLAVRDWFRLME
ncbi:Swt1 family HEPN domain-containing protein [Candidatus Poriferisocius sp.]|uniref:Swt1 family HEPN domain-containing protein n=1 Tax=Candidatus Poriferisocius sp. TaxID=3101276 RepID=UPI003B5B8D18